MSCAIVFRWTVIDRPPHHHQSSPLPSPIMSNSACHYLPIPLKSSKQQKHVICRIRGSPSSLPLDLIVTDGESAFSKERPFPPPFQADKKYRKVPFVRVKAQASMVQMKNGNKFYLRPCSELNKMMYNFLLTSRRCRTSLLYSNTRRKLIIDLCSTKYG